MHGLCSASWDPEVDPAPPSPAQPSLCVRPSVRHAVGCVYSVWCDVNPCPDGCAVPRTCRVARVSVQNPGAPACSPHPQRSAPRLEGAWPRAWAPGWAEQLTFHRVARGRGWEPACLRGSAPGSRRPSERKRPPPLPGGPRGSTGPSWLRAGVSPWSPASACQGHTLRSQSPRPLCRGLDGKAGRPGLGGHITLGRSGAGSGVGPCVETGETSPTRPPGLPSAATGGRVQVCEAEGWASRADSGTHSPGP